MGDVQTKSKKDTELNFIRSSRISSLNRIIDTKFVVRVSQREVYKPKRNWRKTQVLFVH